MWWPVVAPTALMNVTEEDIVVKGFFGSGSELGITERELPMELNQALKLPLLVYHFLF